MGDHRATIKIEMEFHGVKDSCDMWINWSPRDWECEGVDYRVIEFIQKIYNKGIEKYNAQQEEYWAQQRRKDVEVAERKELKRLKQKYEVK